MRSECCAVLVLTENVIGVDESRGSMCTFVILIPTVESPVRK